jgi:hypothetical protein
MQLLRTILIIIIVYYLFKLLVRYVLPGLARYFIRKTVEDIEKQQKSQERKTGGARAENPRDKKSALDNIGEYVDYEEIDDHKTKKK